MDIRIREDELMQWKFIILSILENKNNEESDIMLVDEKLLMEHILHRMESILDRKKLNLKRKKIFNDLKTARDLNDFELVEKLQNEYSFLSDKIEKMY